MSTLPPDFPFNELPGNTIIPSLKTESIFIQYLNRLYEDIAFAVNNKDNIDFTIPISDNPVNIPNLANFGAFIVCVSGIDTTQPVKTWSLVKSDAMAAGVINILGTQAGTVAWTGNNLTITSTATNFQIAHDRAAFTGNFNIRIVGTQQEAIMAKKSALTGTQKKAQKQLAHEVRKGGKFRKQAIEKQSGFLHGNPRYRSTEGKLAEYAYPQQAYTSDSKNPYKGLEKIQKEIGKYKPDFAKEGKQGYKMAERVLEPIQKQAIKNYQNLEVPGISTNLGSESKSSSSLNQALAASRESLAGQLHAQTAEVAARYGSDISKMNLAENARKQQFQYGSAADLFNARREANLGYGDTRRENLSYLNQLGSGAAANLQNAGLAGQQGAFVPPYLQKGQSSGVSPIGGAVVGGLGGAAAGAGIGTALGGPGIGTAIGAGVGAIGGYLSSK